MDSIVDYFNRVSDYPLLQVLVELLLMGLVVYWIVNFLEGTRGERLFHGVTFVLVVGVLVLYLVVDRFGFKRLEYLYDGFIIAILIIAITAFQPEIRRALMRIGQRRFLTGSSHELTRSTEELASAVMQFSRTQTGAIIVIEENIGLGEFIESGVRVDAKITSELLKTIFYSGTPLHDMAVIIQNERIMAASVQLPLAESGTVEGIQLGSRHRAALGITSSSDALAVVVSEETGIISVAKGGHLVRNLTESELRTHITVALGQEPRLAGRFWKRHTAEVQKQIMLEKQAKKV
ncbi:MAG: diadenylate cyclase CdaA [Planctomycetota bacterium]